MSEDLTREQDGMILRQDWEAVGQYLSTALHEVSFELGGEDLAHRIAETIDPESILPNPLALLVIEQAFPGSTYAVLSRAEEIQRAAHEQELKDARKFSFKKLGKAMLDGFAHLNFPGTPLRNL